MAKQQLTGDHRQLIHTHEEQLQRALEVNRRLMAFYGRPEWDASSEPMNELVATILSQNTNDRNRDAAFQALRARFPTWEAVRDADTEEVIATIRTAGLANQKGPRIQAVLREITAERGTLDISFLGKMDKEEARAWLVRFNGIGPKTASIVLLFAFGKSAFPVDTHIYRVTGRIGLRPPNMTVEQAHDHLAGLFPPEDYGPTHLNIIRLGREICQARKPNCPVCPLNDICDYARNLAEKA